MLIFFLNSYSPLLRLQLGSYLKKSKSKDMAFALTPMTFISLRVKDIIYFGESQIITISQKYLF